MLLHPTRLLVLVIIAFLVCQEILKGFSHASSEKNGMVVHQKETLPKPYIDDHSLYNVTRGQDLYVNCTVIDAYTHYEMYWITPQISSRISTHQFRIGDDLVNQLTILNVTEEDGGEYECVIISDRGHDKESTKRYFTIYGKPIVECMDHKYVYNSDSVFKFYCKVISNLFLNITWTFLENLYIENSTAVEFLVRELTDVQYNKSKYEVYSKAEIRIQVSGTLTCQACNVFGCDSVTDIIPIYQYGPLQIFASKNFVMKGSNIEIYCVSFSYLCTHEAQWNTVENNTYIPLIETERLQIASHYGLYNYRSMLKINDVQESDVQNFFCTAECIDIISKNYKLIIYDAVPPFCDKTNMNETVVKYIDMNTEGYKTVILRCFVGGTPKPLVTWFKDSILLKENNQFFFTYNYQELNIRYLKEDDSGKYICRLKNRFGTKEVYQQIIVKNAKWQIHVIMLAIPIAILGISSVILAIFVTINTRREKKKRKELMEAGLMHFEKGALECLNLELTIDDQAELLPYDKKWEFPRERLKLGKQLGSGAFGVVMEAEAIGICKDETVTTVAVKMNRITDPIYTIRALVSELKIMAYLDSKHLNVVNLLGACSNNISKRELLVIVEYCRFGNLNNYLLRHRSDFINQIDSTGKLDLTIGIDVLSTSVNASSNNSLNMNSGTDSVVHYCPRTGPDSQEINFSPDGGILSNDLSQSGSRSNYRDEYKDKNFKLICTQDLLSWAFQVARGMEYLSQRRVLHGDLAARNILLDENNVVKICDFGLAKTLYKDGNYKKKSSIPLPIKWMAIESIKDRIFSTQSDIWSFGIVLWEFFTLAETPYLGMEIDKVYEKLNEGYRLEQPKYAVREVYDIMLQCWETEPTLRPSFTDLVERIDNILEEYARSQYISVHVPYMPR